MRCEEHGRLLREYFAKVRAYTAAVEELKKARVFPWSNSNWHSSYAMPRARLRKRLIGYFVSRPPHAAANCADFVVHAFLG